MKHRGVVMSRKGLVSSAHPLISSTGANILRKGGNAMDAAIAMANTSSVVLPHMCGLGGDTFLLYYDAKSKRITSFNGSGPACEKADIAFYKKKGLERVPMDGILSVTIPGFVETSFTALEKFGTMQFSELCDDAIDLAENGCPISDNMYYYMKKEEKKIRRFEGIARYLLHTDGSLKNPGDLMVNPDLANTFRILCKEGKEAFYKGEIAQKIVETSQRKGGLLSMSDLAKPCCELLEPIHVPYREYMIYQTPPVSQGIAHLEEMNIINHIDFSGFKPESADAIHIMVEAKKMAFTDRARYFGDPKWTKNPVKEILTDTYGQKCANRIQMDRCLDEKDLTAFDEFGHTTSFVVVDKWGNAVSLITSVAGNWGSGEEVEGAGFLLNNRGCQFNLQEGHPNCLQPGKRTMHTINTYLVTDQQGNLKYVGNTPGGDNQPQWNMQVLVNLIDFHMDVQEAVETAKWSHSLSWSDSSHIGYHLRVEKQLGEQEIQKLIKKGHPVTVMEPFSLMGASQIIEVKENGVLFGGSDPRSDGCAMPE